MSVSRGKFLKSLGKSIPGLVLGGGITTAAQRFLGKIAAVTGMTEIPVAAPPPEIATGANVNFIMSGPTDGNRVALTFDDGPTPGVTNLILDELKRRNLHANFFMIGRCVAAEPDLARRVLAEGHEVCNHTYTHPNLTKLTDSQVDAEIQKTQEIMADVLNHQATWFRPPFGALRQNQSGMLMARGLGIVFWNVDPADWSRPGKSKIVGTILKETKPGSIIVCHDLFRQTADGMGAILDGLLEKGFAFATLSELLK